jgi:hypothetical protein
MKEKDFTEVIATRLRRFNEGSEIQLAIEGRFTNLRIWKTVRTIKRNSIYNPVTELEPISDGKVYMRLDKAKQFSVPLEERTVAYLEKEHPIIAELLQFGFESDVQNIERILEITAPLKDRNIIIW